MISTCKAGDTNHTYYYPLTWPECCLDSIEIQPDMDPCQPNLLDPATFQHRLQQILDAPTQSEHNALSTLYGISRPSMLPHLGMLPFPQCLPADSMHLPCLNVPDLLIGLYQGQIHGREPCTWAVLVGSTWQALFISMGCHLPYPRGYYQRMSGVCIACWWLG